MNIAFGDTLHVSFYLVSIREKLPNNFTSEALSSIFLKLEFGQLAHYNFKATTYVDNLDQKDCQKGKLRFFTGSECL